MIREIGCKERTKPRLGSCAATLLAAVVLSAPALAEEKGVAARADSTQDIASMGLEQLMNIEVTSVARKEQRLGNAASAIFVLSEEDIRRSGATSVPEVLRLVPGLHVGRISSNDWAISARGFNSLFANKLLVLVDGRTVYTPLFSGVFWDQQDTVLADVERIEVIRGPGATVWGSNAVNGVINIITKSAHKTKGNLIDAGGGSEDLALVSTRSGHAVGEDGAVRVYGKFTSRDASRRSNPGSAEDEESYDGWHQGRGGIRYDLERDDLKATISSEIYGGREQLELIVPSLDAPFSQKQRGHTKNSGGFLNARLEKKLSDDSCLSVQAYWDRTYRNDDILLNQTHDTFDIDMNHRLRLNDSNELTWGAGFRGIFDSLTGYGPASFQDPNRFVEIASAFLQNEVSLPEEDLKITFGSKFEQNTYTGFEVEPTVRAAWTPVEATTVWGAISRAVRLPSRASDDLRLTSSSGIGADGVPFQTVITGDRGVEAEDLLSYEAGVRQEVTRNLRFDLSAFINSYSNLLAFDQGAPSVNPRGGRPAVIVPLTFVNEGSARTVGGEFVGDLRVLESWRLQGTYSYINVAEGHFNETAARPSLASRNPQHQFSLRSLLTLPGDIELDSQLRYVDRIPAYDIKGYIDLNFRVGWRPTKELDLSVFVENLFHTEKREYQSNFVNFPAAEIQRAIVGRATWRW